MKVENSKGYEIEVDQENPFQMEMFNDWGTCMTFEFDSREQVDELIKMLEVVKERWL